jgi:hypothetical protein
MSSNKNKKKIKKLTYLNQNFGSTTAYAVMYLYKFVPLIKNSGSTPGITLIISY